MEFDQIYAAVNLEIADKDVQLFCYASIWKTSIVIRTEREQELKANFQRILADVLYHSALQVDILKNTLNLVSKVDLKFALDITKSLNTEERRISAMANVLATGFLANPQMDLSEELEESLAGVSPEQGSSSSLLFATS